MRNTLFFLLFISTIVALFAFAFSFSQSNDLDGQQIFTDNKCSKCHSVESLGITPIKDDAVDLSNVGADIDNDFLKNYLLKQESLKEKKHKTKFSGTNAELNALVNWLISLKSEAIETGG